MAGGYWGVPILGAATPHFLVLGRCLGSCGAGPTGGPEHTGWSIQLSPAPSSGHPNVSPGSTGVLALGLQGGHQAVRGDRLCRQRWLCGPLLPDPTAASPQLPAPGSLGCRAARASPVPKNLLYPVTLPNAKGCSFPQRLRAAPARLGGLCPTGGTPQPQPPHCPGLLQPDQPHQTAGSRGERESPSLAPASPQPSSRCTARPSGCDAGSTRGASTLASPSMPPTLLSHPCPHDTAPGRTCQLGRTGDGDGHRPFGTMHSAGGQCNPTKSPIYQWHTGQHPPGPSMSPH